MTDLLSLGSGAINVYKQALATVSNNIANVNTEGYSRQTVAIGQNQPTALGTTFQGTGARLAGIERQFDGFVEQQLRVSTSDLAAQAPLVEFTGRILDRFADQDSALSGALDRFFSSFKALGADASSLALREVAFSDAGLLADRFVSLDGFLDQQSEATEEALNTTVAEINSLGQELAAINVRLARKDALTKQPPGLLDERDSLLRALAEKVRLDVTEAVNGVVTVRLGATAGAGELVEGPSFRALGLTLDPSAEDRLSFFLQPATPAQGRLALSGVGGGALGGVVTFRQQVLEPTRSSLDTLARGLAAELNTLHEGGMALDGAVGRPLLSIKPDYQLVGLDARRGFTLETSLESLTPTQVDTFTLTFDTRQQRWQAEVPSTVDAPARVVLADEDGVIRLDGTGLRVRGEPSGTVTLAVRGRVGGAGDLVLGLERPEHLALADPLRIRAHELNSPAAQAQIRFLPPESAPLGPPSIAAVLGNNTLGAAGKNFLPGQGAVATLPAGSQGVELVLAGATDSSTDLRLLTREGLLLSGPPLTEAEQTTFLSPSQGFTTRASYRTLGPGEEFRDLTLTKGAFSEAPPDGPHRLRSDRTVAVDGAGNLSAAAQAALAGGALTFNGDPLVGALSPDTRGQISAASVAAWFTAQASAGAAGVSAQAENRLTFEEIDFSDHGGLRINGIDVTVASGSAGAVTTLGGLVTAINALSATTGVQAEIGSRGELELTNVAGRAGENIELDAQAGVGTADNILGAQGGVYGGRLSLEGPQAFSLGLGANGSPNVLTALGFDTRLRVEGTMRDDLLVLGSGTTEFTLAAGYALGSFDPLASLREQPLEVRFQDDGGRYQILDGAGGQVLAEGRHLPGAAIRYGGATLTFAGQPQGGDRFFLEDNGDGVDDSRNGLRLAALAETPLTALGERSAAAYYAGLTSRVGTQSRQAMIGQEALTVVKAQAEEARDRISGVSLDEEAADLIRYQQAYQAAAKIIQTSQDLFDAVLAL